MNSNGGATGYGSSAGSTFCAHCGASATKGTKYCASCGKPLAAHSCPSCATHNDLLARFCKKCGLDLNASDGEAAVASQKPLATVTSHTDVAGFAPSIRAEPPRPEPRRHEQPVGAIAESAPDAEVQLRASRRPVESGAYGTVAADASRSAASRPAKKASRVVIALTVAVVGLGGAGALGYLYWIGAIGDRPASVAAQITGEINQSGFPDVRVTMGKDWIAVASGTVVGQDQRQALEDHLASQKNIGEMSLDALIVKPSPREIQAAAERALASRRLTKLTVSIAGDGTATLEGQANSVSEKRMAVDVVNAVAGVTEVVDQTGVSPAWLEREINQSLWQARLGHVRARVQSSESIVVSGTLQAEDERDLVISTVINAAQQIEVPVIAAAISDQMTVVAPRVVAAPPPVSAPPGRQAASTAATGPLPAAATEQFSIEGRWSGQIKGSMFAYTALLEINGGSPGAVVGSSAYFQVVGQRLLCRGQLSMIEPKAPVYMLNDKIGTWTGGVCIKGGSLRMTVTGPGTVDAQWLDRRNENRVLYSGTLKRVAGR